MKRLSYDYSLLPPHIIGDILKYLSSCQLVEASRTCKSWYYESLNPKLNQNTRVRTKFATVPEEFNRPFGILLLQQIDFNVFNYHTFLTKFGNKIHEIEFEYCKLSLDQFFEFLRYVPNLITLKFKSEEEHFLSGINSNKDSAIMLNLKHVKSIEIFLSYPDQGGLQYIMSLMPNLKVISIGNLRPYTNYIFKILFDYIHWSDEVQLDRLCISDLEGAIVHQFFTDFANITTNLTVDTVTLGMISSSSYMTNHEENFTNFCKKISGVTTFSMKGPRECHFTDICRHMTNLRELHLTYAAIKHFTGIECLRNLEKLHLTCTVCYRGSNYDEDAFMAMFTKLAHLKELSTNLYPITDRVLNAICTNCINLIRLELLRTKTCNFVPIFGHLKKLKSLRLQLSAQVDYKNFDATQDITNLPTLENLDINAFVPGLTLELIERLPNLNPASLQMIKSNVFTKYGII